MARKYLIETFGCQMNVHDSERMAGLLEQAGYEADGRPGRGRRRRAQHVQRPRARRGEALLAARRAAGRVSDRRRAARSIAVAGCVAQQEGAVASSGAPRTSTSSSGTQAARRLPMLVDEAAATRPARRSTSTRTTTSSFPARRRPPRRTRSRPTSPSSRAATTSAPSASCPTRGATSGCARRPTSWRRCARRSATGRQGGPAARADRQPLPGAGRPGVRFRRRCSRRSTTSPGVERIRFASPHPRHASDAARSRRFATCRRSASTCTCRSSPARRAVLQAMRRRHTREDYLRPGRPRCGQAVPGIALSTDMIVGFPGETDEDFEETLSLVERGRASSSMFSFKYSERPNTLAAKRHAGRRRRRSEKARRLAELQDAAEGDPGGDCTRRRSGASLEVLVDSRQPPARRTNWRGGRRGTRSSTFPGQPRVAGADRAGADRRGPARTACGARRPRLAD